MRKCSAAHSTTHGGSAHDGWNAFSFAALITTLALGLTPDPAQALPLTITTTTLRAGTTNVAYADTVASAAGTAPIAWTLAAGSLPAGLSLGAASGAISGTPTLPGTSAFIVRATDALGDTATRALSILVEGVPAPVGDLAAARLGSGNDADGTARIQLTFSSGPFSTSAEVYRAPFGAYPRYDDAGGFIPPTPSYPPGPPWVLTAVTATSQTDEPATRDAWSYVAYVKNTAGAPSTVSNKTAPTTNYALGDVSNGVTAGTGDNHVDDLDVSLLGAHYGITGDAIVSAGVSYLDVGPTTDLALTSRPFTDNRLDFEDLIVFASNYGAISAPASLLAGLDERLREARGPERLWIDAPLTVAAGESFGAVVHVHGEGRMQGLSAELAWDGSVAEPVGVERSGWFEAQKGVVLSPRAGTVDAALLGARVVGLEGEGELATVTFRALRSGEPALRFGRVLARDAANRPLPPAALALGGRTQTPARTLLLAPSPNPSHGSTRIACTLSQASTIELAVYSIDGRRVRTLAQGEHSPGSHSFTWAGDDDAGRPVAPGLYYARLAVSGGPRFTRPLVHLF